MFMLNTLIFDTTNALVFVLITLFIGTFMLLCIPSYKKYMIKIVTLGVSCVVYLISLFLWILFNKSTGSFQFVNKILWIPFFNFSIGIDGISLFFILLTTLLIFLCVLISWTKKSEKYKNYVGMEQQGRARPKSPISVIDFPYKKRRRQRPAQNPGSEPPMLGPLEPSSRPPGINLSPRPGSAPEEIN